jgi:hypothetical protein
MIGATPTPTATEPILFTSVEEESTSVPLATEQQWSTNSEKNLKVALRKCSSINTAEIHLRDTVVFVLVQMDHTPYPKLFRVA